MSSNELKTTNTFDLAPLNGDSAELSRAMKEDLAGLGMPDLARVKMPSGGTPMFTIYRSKEDENPEMVKALEGVIVLQHPAYAWWENPTVGAGVQPDCSSLDGESGILSPERGGDVLSCAECPNNRFGSELRPDGTRGRGKACKNGHRIYLLREGELMPTVMTIPPTGLRAWKAYIQELLMPREHGVPMRRFWQVVTRIGLKSAKSGDGTAYCVPTFAVAQELSADAARAIKEYGQAFANASSAAADSGDLLL